MYKNMKRFLSKLVALALAFSMLGVAAPDAEAASKPKLSKKSITVQVKKSKTIKVKKVKAKKIKKLTVKSAKKKIATVKKKNRTTFVIKGKKAGKTTVTAKVKVGKKTTTLKVKVTVKKAKTPTPAPTTKVTAAPTSNATATPSPGTTTRTRPTVRPLLSDSEQEARPEGTPIVNYNETFDESVGEWYARYDPAQGNEAKLTLSDEAYAGKAIRISGRDGHGWNGPAFDFSAGVTLGASYKMTFYAKLPSEYSEDFAGDTINLRFSGAYKTTSTDEEAYENYPADTDYPINADTWTKYEVDFTAPSTIYSYLLYFESNGGGKYDFLIDEVSLVRTSAPAEADLTLDSLKDTYSPYIENFGTAITYPDLLNENVMAFTKHHFNSITMGNSMKPDALMSSKNVLKQSDAKYVLPDNYASYAANKDDSGNVIVPEFTLDEIDKVLKIAKENGIKLRFHTLIWHQQMPKFFFCEQYDENKAVITDKEVILAREEMYIVNVLDYVLTSPYADALYAIDVVNEYTHMSNISEAVGSDNWWKYSFGTEMKTDCEYVKKAFVWAYDELELFGRTKDISLIYNDYNTYEPKITSQIIELINNINKVDSVNKYGKICAGVGMQAHFNDSNGTVENFKTALDKFAEQSFEIQITELDVTNTGTVDSSTSAEDKEMVWNDNAVMYTGIMQAILEAKAAGANISSVTIWGTTDAGSWRANRAPVLFGTDISDVKPSFYAVIDAAKNYGK